MESVLSHRIRSVYGLVRNRGSHLPCAQGRHVYHIHQSNTAFGLKSNTRNWNIHHRMGDTRCRSAAKDEIIDVEGEDVAKIPVTVITGFLGSGKTTLLNRILTEDHGQRIAVIENEFGEIDIDSDLVSIRQNLDPSKEQIMMLNNGCLCCTVRDDLIEMLNALNKRRQDFDRIVIETTGLANPAPIIQTFFLEPSISETMKLDGVVTLVDAKHAELHLDEIKADGVVNEAVEQVAFADRIILNKTDLVSSQDLNRLEGRLKSINSMASIIPACKAEVPIDYVLGVGGFDLEKVEEDLLAPKQTLTTAVSDGHHHHHHDHDHHHHHDHDHHHDHECGPDCKEHSHDHHHHHHHHHDDRVRSVSLTVDGNLDLERVNFWLSNLIELKSNDLFRMKGVLAIDGFDRRFVFQGVHMLFEGMPDKIWEDGEPRQSKMVFIGKDLDESILREGFDFCIVPKK